MTDDYILTKKRIIDFVSSELNDILKFDLELLMSEKTIHHKIKICVRQLKELKRLEETRC